MQIRKLDRHVFDVFQGTGFDEWSRIRRFHWGYKVVNGLNLNRTQMNDVREKLEQYPNGAINNV